MGVEASQYWAKRLASRSALRLFDKAIEFRDYRRRPGDAPEWPSLIRKEALYEDFFAEYGAGLTMSRFYQDIGPLIYPYGNMVHKSRLELDNELWVEGEVYPGRAQKAYFKLAPHPVCEAHANLVWRKGTVTEQTLRRRVVIEGAKRFNLDPEEFSGVYALGVAAQPYTGATHRAVVR